MKKRKAAAPALREYRAMDDKEAKRFARLAASGPAIEAPDMDHEQTTSDVAGAFAAGNIPIDWYIEDQDPEKFRVEYGNMLHDPAVKAALLALLFEVCALDINVTPCEGEEAESDEAESEAQEVADFVKYALTSAKGGYGRGVLMKIAKPALQHQFSISEIVYKAETKGRWAGKWVLQALKSKDVTNGMWQFRVDAYKNVLAIMHMQEGQNRAFETSKFVHYTFMPDFENPRGLSHLRAAYRAWWVKRTVLRAWAVMSEKQGLIPYGSYAADGQKKALEEQLKKFSARRWLAVPDGVKLDVIRYTSAESGKAQQDILRDLDKQIFLGIRLAFLQALEGDRTGARSMGEVHESTADLMAWWLSTDLCGVINEQIVPDLVRYNFGEDVGCPTVKLEAAVNEDLEVRSRVDKNLTDIGLPLSKAELYEVYGRKQPKDEEDALKKAEPPPSPFGPGGAPVGPGKPGVPPVPGQGKQGPPPPPKDGQEPPGKQEPPKDKGEGKDKAEGEETVTLSARDEAWLKRAFGAMDGALNFLAGQAAEADLAFDPDQPRAEDGEWTSTGGAAKGPTAGKPAGQEDVPPARRKVWEQKTVTAAELYGKTPPEPVKTKTLYHVTTWDKAEQILANGFNLTLVKPRWVNDYAVSTNPGVSSARKYFQRMGEPFNDKKYAVLELKVRGRSFDAVQDHGFGGIGRTPQQYAKNAMAAGYDMANGGGFIYNTKAIASIRAINLPGVKLAFDPDQARDENGMWTSEGGAAAKVAGGRPGKASEGTGEYAGQSKDPQKLVKQLQKDRIASRVDVFAKDGDIAYPQDPERFRSSYVESLRQVGAETTRMRQGFAGIDKLKPIEALAMYDSPALPSDVVGRASKVVNGLYRYGSRKMDLARVAQAEQAAPSLGGRGWCTDKSAAGLYRHEFGHHVWGQSSKGMRDDWMQVQKSKDPKHGWRAALTVSRYADTDAHEHFAEAFCAWTHPAYQKGSLLPQTEAFFQKHFARKKGA